MTIKGVGQTAREVFLTFGALLGALCIIATIAGVAFGVKPLVFRSGSMSPAIHTGDLAVSRTVDASALKTGDIVSVVNSEGNRVTHRLVNIASQGDARQLTLKGDANTVADAEVYTVDKAERVLFHIPKAGYLVNAAASPAGVFALGVYVTAMLLLVVRGKGPKDGPGELSARRKGGARKADSKTGRTAARTIGTVAFAASLAVAVATPAVATPWTDTVVVSGGSYTAGAVLPPVSVTCTGGGLGSSLTFRWPNKDLAYSYRVFVEKPAGNVVSSAVVANNGTVGTNQSYVLSLGLLGSLLGVSSTFTVRVESERAFTSTTWSSTGGPTDTGTFTLGLLTSC